MKNLLITITCCCIALLTACGQHSAPQNSIFSEESTGSMIQTPEEGPEDKAVNENPELGLTINDIYYPLPISLEQMIADGWQISDQAPHFLEPLVGEDYYEMRADWSLSEDGQGILPGGSIIRLLEKDGVLLEVTIANLVPGKQDEPYRKTEDCVVDSILVFYDAKHTSIKLNGQELNGLTPDILVKEYPIADGWTHAPTNYRDHPELGIATEYTITNDLDQCSRNITVYFDLENKPFKVAVENQSL